MAAIFAFSILTFSIWISEKWPCYQPTTNITKVTFTGPKTHFVFVCQWYQSFLFKNTAKTRIVLHFRQFCLKENYQNYLGMRRAAQTRQSWRQRLWWDCAGTCSARTWSPASGLWRHQNSAVYSLSSSCCHGHVCRQGKKKMRNGEDGVWASLKCQGKQAQSFDGCKYERVCRSLFLAAFFFLS